jgi:hypothetical protein
MGTWIRRRLLIGVTPRFYENHVRGIKMSLLKSLQRYIYGRPSINNNQCDARRNTNGGSGLAVEILGYMRESR